MGGVLGMRGVRDWSGGKVQGVAWSEEERDRKGMCGVAVTGGIAWRR